MADESPEDRSAKGNNEGGGGPPRDEGQGRRGGRHRGFRGRHGGRAGGNEAAPGGNREDQNRNPKTEEGREAPLCPICGKAVYDLSTAIAASREAADPAHFDCILERVTASESLASGEKIVYLGSGSFAVVEFKDKSESAFSVKRRIQWEKEGEKKEWRKGISSRVTNL
jgi:hypothetical protein